MIAIDLGDLKDEITPLKDFLASKLSVEVEVKDKTMNVGKAEDKLSRGGVKDIVERFFYRKSLTESYKVTIDKDALKIVKKKK